MNGARWRNLVTGSYLKIAVAFLALAVAGLVVLNVKTIHTFRNFKPLVIRIDELGRVQALSYDSFAYKPEAKEAKYFLTQFCQLYYRRNRYTINDDFTKSFYFLDGRLANDIMAADQKSKVVETFLNNPSAPEVDIDVQQVAIEPMINPPYRASVDFYKIQYSRAEHALLPPGCVGISGLIANALKVAPVRSQRPELQSPPVQLLRANPEQWGPLKPSGVCRPQRRKFFADNLVPGPPFDP